MLFKHLVYDDPEKGMSKWKSCEEERLIKRQREECESWQRGPGLTLKAWWQRRPWQNEAAEDKSSLHVRNIGFSGETERFSPGKQELSVFYTDCNPLKPITDSCPNKQGQVKFGKHHKKMFFWAFSTSKMLLIRGRKRMFWAYLLIRNNIFSIFLS